VKPPIGRDTQLCMSLSARPGNLGSRFHNHLYEALGLDYVYKASAPAISRPRSAAFAHSPSRFRPRRRSFAWPARVANGSSLAAM